MGAGDWLRRQLGGRFGAASKNGGDTTPNTSLAERIKLLETNLDKFTGDLLEGNNAVSKDVKDTVGRVQAATIALIKAYDAGDEAAKKALKDSGFIKEWQGNAEFNAGQIFGISKGVGNFPTLEEKTRAVAIAIEAKVKELGVTDAQLQEGLAINNTRGGANPDPAASTATPITPIYSALDPNLGAASKAIAGIHIAMRSGVGRILSGAPDQNAATKAQKTNFNGKIFEDDPAYMKRMLKSGTRLNAHERGEEPEILPEDVDNIRAGMQEAIANLRVAGAALGKNADLSAIVQQAEKYTELVNGIDSVTPRYKANPAKQRGLFVGDEEEEEVTVADNPLASLDGVLKALEAQQETAADDAAAKTKAAFNQTKTGQEGQYQIQEIKQQKAFLNAYVGAVGEKNVAQEGLNTTVSSGALGWLAEKLDVTSAKKGEVVFTEKSGAYSFTVTPKSITHTDTDSVLKAEEAFISARLASMNARMAKNGVTIGGTDQEKALYYVALQSQAPKMTVNNADEIAKIDPSIIESAQRRFESFLDERTHKNGTPNFAILKQEAVNDNQPSAPVQKPGEPTPRRPLNIPEPPPQ